MWYLWALLSAIFGALVSITAKIALKNIDPILMTGIRAVFMAIIMIFVVLYTFKQNHNLFQNLHGNDLFWILLAGISGAISWVFYFIALKYGPVKGVYAIDKASVFFVLLFSFLVLKDQITTKAILGAVLMFVGILLLQ